MTILLKLIGWKKDTGRTHILLYNFISWKWGRTSSEWIRFPIEREDSIPRGPAPYMNMTRERQNMLLHIFQVAVFWAYQYFFRDSECFEQNEPYFVEHIFAYFAKIPWFCHEITFFGHTCEYFENFTANLPFLGRFWEILSHRWNFHKNLRSHKIIQKFKTLNNLGEKLLKKSTLIFHSK